MKRKKPKLFLYRVESVDSSDNSERYVAEVLAMEDEDSRRVIIHKVLSDGGRVISIECTDDRTRYPGEARRRRFEIF